MRMGIVTGSGTYALPGLERMPVRAGLGVADGGQHALLEHGRHCVLEALRLLVDLIPGHVQGPDQEELEQAMAADHLHRQPFTGAGQPCALIGRVGRQVRLGEGLEHPGHGARRDVQRLRELARPDGVIPLGSGGDQRDRLFFGVARCEAG